MKSFLSFLVLVLMINFCIPTIASAQKVRGSGKVIKQDRNLSGFHEIYVKDGVDVYITQGNSDAVVVKADDNLVDFIKTEVENGILYISSTAHSIYNTKSFDVQVSIRNLDKIKAKQGSDVYGESKIKTDDLTLELSSGSDLKMEIYANTLNCSLHGGSDVDLKGKVHKLVAQAKGGSDIMAKKLETYTCEIHAYGGSDAYVNVKDELNAQAFGSSDIHYYGDPAVLHSKAKGGSDIYGN